MSTTENIYKAKRSFDINWKKKNYLIFLDIRSNTKSLKSIKLFYLLLYGILYHLKQSDGTKIELDNTSPQS